MCLTQHSTVFVADGHSVWSPERQRKQRKKYGNLVKSERRNLNDMLSEHHSYVLNKLTEGMENFKTETALPTSETMDTKDDIQTAIEADQMVDGMTTLTPAIAIKDEDISSPGRVSASPHPMRSPHRMPPVGTFTVTTPDRNAL
jgi:histone deacetylase 6